jgi:hypothetical protein
VFRVWAELVIISGAEGGQNGEQRDDDRTGEHRWVR